MAEYMVQDASIELIADAIRAKAGVSGKLSFPDGFAAAIAAIESGSQVVTGTATSTANTLTLSPGFPIRAVMLAYEANAGVSNSAKYGIYVDGNGTFRTFKETVYRTVDMTASVTNTGATFTLGYVSGYSTAERFPGKMAYIAVS